MFSHMNEREREREREREWGGQETIKLWTFNFIFLFYTGISNPHSPSYKTEAKKLKEKTEQAACLDTAIQFSIGSLLPQISSLKYAPVTSCDVEGSFSIFKNVISYKRMKQMKTIWRN